LKEKRKRKKNKKKMVWQVTSSENGTQISKKPLWRIEAQNTHSVVLLQTKLEKREKKKEERIDY